MLKATIVPVTPLQQNCTILFDDETKEAVIVDPGGDAAYLADAVKQLGVTPQAIWLTHGHLDHAGGAEAVKETYGIDIIGPHKADKFLLDNIETSAANYGFAGMMMNAAPDRWLNEGETLLVGSHRFEVFHTPGHAPGHVIFVNRETPITIMGDVLFNGSVGRTDLPGSDHQALMRSIRDKVLPLGDDMFFLCGHGPNSSVGFERQNNPFLQDLRDA